VNRLYTWARELKGRRECVENESHDRHPRTSHTDENIRAVQKLIELNHRLTVEEINEQWMRLTSTSCYQSAKAVYWSKRRGMPIRNVILLHDNTRPHTALLIRNKLEEMCWETLEHLSYSPDLSPCEYFLFEPLKELFGAKRFTINEEVEEHVAQLAHNSL